MTDQKPQRMIVLKEVAELSIDGYLLKDVIKDLTDMLDTYGDAAQVSKEAYSYDGGTYLALLVPTPETDKEMNARLIEEATYAKIKEDRERVEFERLKAKFGSAS